jgi:hypothetical protein
MGCSFPKGAMLRDQTERIDNNVWFVATSLKRLLFKAIPIKKHLNSGKCWVLLFIWVIVSFEHLFQLYFDCVIKYNRRGLQTQKRSGCLLSCLWHLRHQSVLHVVTTSRKSANHNIFRDNVCNNHSFVIFGHLDHFPKKLALLIKNFSNATI